MPIQELETPSKELIPEYTPRVAIVTDSVAQVPVELAQELNIHVVPGIVLVEDQKFLDGVDLDVEAVYRRMRQQKDLHMSTSAPSAGQFYLTYLNCFNRGFESVLYVGLTSRMSATFSAAEGGAMLARDEYADRQIALFDTRTATIAQGFIAIEAARLAAQGAHLDKILERIHQVRQRVGVVASFESLEYLARGGRIGKAAFMLSSMIHIIPIVTVDGEGVVEPVGRVRGRQRALDKMVEYTSQRVHGSKILSLGILHADAREQAETLYALVMEQLHPDEIFITPFTPMMAAHTGPGTIGLAFQWDA